MVAGRECDGVAGQGNGDFAGRSRVGLLAGSARLPAPATAPERRQATHHARTLNSFGRERVAARCPFGQSPFWGSPVCFNAAAASMNPQRPADRPGIRTDHRKRTIVSHNGIRAFLYASSLPSTAAVAPRPGCRLMPVEMKHGGRALIGACPFAGLRAGSCPLGTRQGGDRRHRYAVLPEMTRERACWRENKALSNGETRPAEERTAAHGATAQKAAISLPGAGGNTWLAAEHDKSQNGCQAFVSAGLERGQAAAAAFSRSRCPAPRPDRKTTPPRHQFASGCRHARRPQANKRTSAATVAGRAGT